MRTVTSGDELQTQALAWRARGLRVGFVPTMGSLHDGHTSLLDLARPRCDRLVVSIFVNPLQFGPREDLSRYPRDPEGDAARCRDHGCDVLFLPDEGQFYPADFVTSVAVGSLTAGLCGRSRPTHFQGVTTVVARLFGLVQPSLAVFGEKDWQQLQVVRRMVRDLAMPVEVLGGPLVREPDGLALSSRNAYLQPDERRRAPSLFRALTAMQQAADAGTAEVGAILRAGRQELDVDRLDYLEIVDAESLAPLSHVTAGRPARACVAAWVGPTRLIDNVPVGP